MVYTPGVYEAVVSKLRELDSQSLCQHCKRRKTYTCNEFADEYACICTVCQPYVKVTRCGFCYGSFAYGMVMEVAAKHIGRLVCQNCLTNLANKGEPKVCKWCKQFSAFETNSELESTEDSLTGLCGRCKHNHLKYGPACCCSACSKWGAFMLSPNEIKKVDGHLLCFRCSEDYQEMRIREYTRQNRNFRERSKSKALLVNEVEGFDTQYWQARFREIRSDAEQCITEKDLSFTVFKKLELDNNKKIENAKAYKKQKEAERTKESHNVRREKILNETMEAEITNTRRKLCKEIDIKKKENKEELESYQNLITEIQTEIEAEEKAGKDLKDRLAFIKKEVENAEAQMTRNKQEFSLKFEEFTKTAESYHKILKELKEIETQVLRMS